MTAEGNEHLSTVVVPIEVKTLKTEVVDGGGRQRWRAAALPLRLSYMM